MLEYSAADSSGNRATERAFVFVYSAVPRNVLDDDAAGDGASDDVAVSAAASLLQGLASVPAGIGGSAAGPELLQLSAVAVAEAVVALASSDTGAVDAASAATGVVATDAVDAAVLALAAASPVNGPAVTAESGSIAVVAVRHRPDAEFPGFVWEDPGTANRVEIPAETYSAMAASGTTCSGAIALVRYGAGNAAAPHEALFQHRTTRQLAGDVLSLQLERVGPTGVVGGPPSVDLGTARIGLTFGAAQGRAGSCTWWGGAASGWLTGSSCERLNASSPMFYTSHLTNFAFLATGASAESGASAAGGGHEAVLSALSDVAVAVNVVCFAILFLTYTLFSSLREHVHIILMHAGGSLSAALLVIALVAEPAAGDNHDGACADVAILLHFLLMATFLWSAVLGYHFHLVFVRVLGGAAESAMHGHQCVLAYGGAAAIVVATATSSAGAYGTDDLCWLDVDSDAMRYGVILPLACVLVANLYWYWQAVRNIWHARDKRVAVLSSVLFFLMLGLVRVACEVVLGVMCACVSVY